MNPVPDVLFAFLGDVRESSRALRQLRALVDMGASVEVLTLGPAQESRYLADGLEVGRRFNVQMLSLSTGRGPAYFRQFDRCASKAAKARGAKVFFASDLFALPPMARAAKRHQGRLVFDSRELYSHLDSFVGRQLVRQFWSAVERRYIRHADLVFTVNRSIAECIATTYGIELPTVLHNVPPMQNVPRTNKLREDLGISPDARIALYQGGIRTGRGLPRLIEAARAIEEVAFVIIGSGALSETLKIQARGLANVFFLPHISPDKLLRYTASADLGVHLLEPTCLNHKLALPNKIFEYLMVGLPVVANSLPEIRNVVEDYGVGLVVDPEDADAVVAAIRRALYDEEIRASWRANIPNVFEDYSWKKDMQRFQDAISTLLADIS